MQGIWYDRQINQKRHEINIGTETLLGRHSVVEKLRQSLRIVEGNQSCDNDQCQK